MAKSLEITLTKEFETFESKLKSLLSNKDKLVDKELKDGRNQYQVEIQKLKDKMKAYKKGGGEGYISFGKLLKNVKGQEREGKFDRGAEGKTKKKLRAKMGQEREELFTSGRHKESDADKYIKEKIPQYLKVPEKKKKESVGKSR
jgi:ElaB/YqjD/DUF883 family membrane-anchored ribosome-binding protein